MIQEAMTQTMNLAPGWLLGIMFILEVFTAIVLEKKRRILKNGYHHVRDSDVCQEHSDLVNRLIRIEKKLDQEQILDKLDTITNLLQYSVKERKPE